MGKGSRKKLYRLIDKHRSESHFVVVGLGEKHDSRQIKILFKFKTLIIDKRKKSKVEEFLQVQ